MAGRSAGKEDTMSMEERLKEIRRKVDNARNRLQGRRPHPNDVHWAKNILDDIDRLATEAIAKAQPELEATK